MIFLLREGWFRIFVIIPNNLPTVNRFDKKDPEATASGSFDID